MNTLRPTGARNLSLLFRNASPSARRQFLRHSSSSPTSSVSPDELSHFSGLASSWWDPLGPSRILHLMNPLRHDFIGSCLSDGSPLQSRPSDREAPVPYEEGTDSSVHNEGETGLKYLDIGCGGGIFAESLARTIPLSMSGPYTPTRASSILAIDPSTTLISIAAAHARKDPTLYSHLQTGRFRYENTTLENLSSLSYPSSSSSASPSSSSDSPEIPKFDVVTLFEVLEHVDPSTSSPSQFLEMCLRHVRPGGWLIGSTIARTIPSYLVNKVVAEAPWPLGVVPRGTHEWSKFVNADEVRAWAEDGLRREEQASDASHGGRNFSGTQWKCIGVLYVPGFGWKMMTDAEEYGNYFWAVRKGS
ncbi:Hexaprenyldihydroxybenzoate methyltransferase, mitochondrial [Arachnomyces sp. PD_36]|nr:Hexaprenyldihydroxybenzoate methyltransferase, mitochondrial [Arachnomyces sp. PD_36]